MRAEHERLPDAVALEEVEKLSGQGDGPVAPVLYQPVCLVLDVQQPSVEIEPVGTGGDNLPPAQPAVQRTVEAELQILIFARIQHPQGIGRDKE